MSKSNEADIDLEKLTKSIPASNISVTIPDMDTMNLQEFLENICHNSVQNFNIMNNYLVAQSQLLAEAAAHIENLYKQLGQEMPDLSLRPSGIPGGDDE